MRLRFLLLLVHLADYAAKLALLIRLATEQGALWQHFLALASVHAATNLHCAFAACQRLQPSPAVCPLVLLFGLTTPLLQVWYVLEQPEMPRGSSSRGSIRCRVAVSPIEAILDSTAFMLATLHIHFSAMLGRVEVERRRCC
eukprot:TRINITY_DN8720_c0_g1_i4.p2 TRINITY_DN8720_c0_g1~~TRINITY_DN8720_c0_g1_i4.p2  ORF type:complete len:142 (-),score=18.96 TRINITY_DN8720_c0_g1_i4:152-577(-)